MQVLFVGGSYNGELIEVPQPRLEIVMPKKRIRRPPRFYKDEEDKAAFEVEYYTLEHVVDKDGRTEHVMYMLDNPPLPMNMLMHEFAKMANKLREFYNG